MVGDANATRTRLLEAATREFAFYGIAGARVDRIAEEAKCNKAQIYHYFDSKDGLFDAVFNAMSTATVNAVPIDCANLAEYAGRLFDHYEKHPEVPRLATWHRLERGDTYLPLRSVVASTKDKVAAIAQAQKRGELSSRYVPLDLLIVILHLSLLWTTAMPEFDASAGSRRSRAHRRQIVCDAVAAVLQE